MGKREAPAYQEYAASVLASIQFREAGMASRGLLWTLKLECWVNGKVPADPKRLAKVLGTSDDLTQLLAEVISFFEIEGEYLTCPELDAYRTELNDRRTRQSAGGKAGAEKTNSAKNKTPIGNTSGKPSGNSSANPPGSSRDFSIDKNSTDKNSTDQSIESGDIPNDEFVSAYEEFESNAEANSL